MNEKMKEDDKKVVANMNVDGMPWYDPVRAKREKEGKKVENDYSSMSRNETWDFVMAIYRFLLPIAFIVIAIYAIVILLIGHPWNT